MTQQQWGGPPQWGQRRASQGRPGWGQQAPQWGQSPWGQQQSPYGNAQSPFGGQAPWGNQALSRQQQGYGRQPYGRGPFPPPRRRHPLRSLFRALMFVVLLIVGGLVASNLLHPSSQADQPYQNDQYKVPPADKTPPPLPVPETYTEARQLVLSNAFYDQTAPVPVRCTATPVNVATASDAKLKEHFESLMECLVRVWEPPLSQAGFTIVRPTVTIYGREITTRCGKSSVNAFYCSADQQVYFSNQLANYIPIVKTNKWAADVVMAHEFGHELQARSAILISANALGQQTKDQAAELEMSRRIETQADCFSGMFTNAVSQDFGITRSDRAGIENTFAAVGDDEVSGKSTIVGNHGLARSRKYWNDIGLGTSSVGRCNTFRASSSLVR